MTKPNKVGLVLAALIGGWHLLWIVLIAAGWAQPLINFVFWAHMIQPIYVIKAFDPAAAVALLIITSISGYLTGYIGAMVWNKMHRPSSVGH